MRNRFVAIEIRIGPPATGDNFFARPALLARLMRALKRGNVAFLGPRRTGKTSCLREIQAHPGSYLPILLNLEKLHTVEDWLAAMVDGLRAALEKPAPRFKDAQNQLSGLLERVKGFKLPGGVGVDLDTPRHRRAWAKSAREFLDLLAQAEMPILFLLDEFDHVLDTLKHDGYLLQRRQGEQRTSFASNMLRDYWCRKSN